MWAGAGSVGGGGGVKLYEPPSNHQNCVQNSFVELHT